MKYSKAFSLLQVLPPKDLEAVELSLKTAKRAGVKKLFDALKGSLNDGEPENAEVFKRVFGKKYSKQEDYLLRNEYRLLYERMQEVVLKKQHEGSEFESPELLAYLLKHRADELFEDEFAAAWKKAVEGDDVDVLVKLSDLNLQYHLVSKPQTLSNAERLTLLSSQRIELLQKKFLRDIRLEEIRLKLSERIISAYKNVEQPYLPLQVAALDRLEENDLYAKYLSKRAKINFAKGYEKIELVKSILTDEEIIRKYERNALEALCRFWLNIAQEYYINSDFAEAIPYFAKVYEHFNELPFAVQEPAILNYVLALMRNENLDTAIEVGRKHTNLLLQGKVISSRGPFLIAVLHLYARDADKAESYVNLEAKKEGSEFYFFMRLILSAVYYLRGEVGLASRECINVDQAINYEMNRDFTKQTEISKPIVAVFRRFYHVLQHSAPDKLREELVALSQQLKENMPGKSDQSPNSILTDWLRREVEQLLGSGKFRM